MFFLFNVIIAVVLGLVLGFVAGLLGMASLATIVSSLYSLAVLIPGIAVSVRRMHDTGRSGWWILCPIANIIFLFLDSQPGPNQYGPNPKGA